METRKSEFIKPELPDCELLYFPGFLPKEEADGYFDHLYREVSWRQDNIKVFGKVYPQPRLTALYGELNKTYTYSGLTMEPLALDSVLKKLKKRTEEYSGVSFTSCLLNLYRTGNDSNGWHSDDEKELGNCPVIASVSLGQDRYFHLRHKSKKELKHKILLEHGSLLIMKGETQHFWQHQLPKSKKPMNPRINLTFRVIK